MQPTATLLCPSSHLKEARSLGFQLDGLSLFIVRRHGTVHAYRNRCPHRGIALNWQADCFLDDSASLVHCAHHGALFLIENGECVTGPCAGEHLEALACREDAQGIWLMP